MQRLLVTLVCLLILSGIARAQPRVLPPGNQDDRISIEYVDEDDDGAGHSQWPKYLIGRDADGNKRWQFPAELTYQPGTMSHTALSSSQIGVAVDVPGTGMVLVVDAGRTLYGVRVRDGKALWKKAHFPYFITRTNAHGMLSRLGAGTVYAGGCFAFGPSYGQGKAQPNPASIVYITPQTGKVRPVMFGPPVRELSLWGEDLRVETEAKVVRYYSIPDLLTSPAPKAAAPHSQMRPRLH